MIDYIIVWWISCHFTAWWSKQRPFPILNCAIVSILVHNDMTVWKMSPFSRRKIVAINGNKEYWKEIHANHAILGTKYFAAPTADDNVKLHHDECLLVLLWVSSTGHQWIVIKNCQYCLALGVYLLLGWRSFFSKFKMDPVAGGMWRLKDQVTSPRCLSFSCRTTEQIRG